CQAGTCVGASPVVCTALDQCHTAGTCDTTTGVCSNPNKPNGTTCTDGNACTQSDACQAGTCVGANPVLCSAQDPCHSARACYTPSKARGPPRSARNACTTGDVCNAGACTGGAAPNCDDGTPCTDDFCAPSVACRHTNNTAPCNDGNACTQADVCSGGICVGSNPVVCTASDQCHVAGTCNTTTGVCSTPSKADGSTCNAGNACSQTDTCQAGACVGSNPVVCTASDQCHTAGTCDTATGVCSNPNQANGTACNDGNA